MLNPKANDRSTWVVQREYQDSQGIVQTEYRDSQGQLHTEAKDPAELAKSYESGYVDGVLVEEHNQNTQLKREEAASRNVSRGLLISLIIAGVIGVTGAMAYYLFQVNNPSPLTVVTTPVYQTEPEPSPSPPPVENSAANNPAAEPVESEPQDVNVTVVTEPAAPAPAPAAPTKAPPKAAVAPSAKTATAPPKAPAIATPSPQAKPIALMAPVILPPNSPVVSNGTTPSSLKTDNQLKSEIVQEFNKQFSGNLLLVSVNQGNVTISGTAASPEQLEKIEPLLESIAGVKKIDVKVTLKVSSN